MDDHKLEAGVTFLKEAGLNLIAVLDGAALPATVTKMLHDTGVPQAAHRRLVLLGHGGRRLWAALQDWGMQTANPVDHYSTTITRQFIRDYLGDPPTHWLYPDTPYLVPLQQLGQLAHWSHPSPLGLGIHPQYGVWFAYRTAFLTTLELPLRKDTPRPAPCESCAERPCISTCPVDAVQFKQFDVDACAQHRLPPQSPCADRCPARMACPFFPEHRYMLPQIQYHYRHSLHTLRAWYG